MWWKIKGRLNAWFDDYAGWETSIKVRPDCLIQQSNFKVYNSWINNKYQHCQLDPKEHISMKYYLKFESFHLKCLQNGGHFASALMCSGTHPNAIWSTCLNYKIQSIFSFQNNKQFNEVLSDFFYLPAGVFCWQDEVRWRHSWLAWHHLWLVEVVWRQYEVDCVMEVLGPTRK